MNATPEQPGSRRDPEQLERAADRIRADLNSTLDALERKLSPSQLLDRSLEYLREHGGEMVNAVGESVRRHPVPIALTAAGLSWLIFAAVRKREPIDVSPIHDMPIEDTPIDDTLETESLYAEPHFPRRRFRDRVSAARAQARRAQYRAISTLDERPLLFGGLAIAVGALLGAIIPSTEYEDKVVGQVRDRAVERARQMGEREYRNLRERFESHQDVEVSGQAH